MTNVIWRPWLGALVVLPLLACGSERRTREEPAPAEEKESTALAADVERADGAMVALQSRLIEALTTELDRTGPVGAVEVCRDIAQDITAQASSAADVRVGMKR